MRFFRESSSHQAVLRTLTTLAVTHEESAVRRATVANLTALVHDCSIDTPANVIGVFSVFISLYMTVGRG